MYIFRWLMKRPIIILALYFLSIIAILYSMKGGDSDKVVVEPKDESAVVQVSSSSEEVDINKTPEIEASSLTNALVTGAKESEELKLIADTEPKAIQADSTTSDKAEEELVVNISETEKTEEVPSKKEEAAETQVSPEIAESTETKPTTDEAALSAQFNEMSAEEMLLMAREAYWNNGLDESAQIYQQLIELNPEMVDYRGELGNVYWRQGFPKKAAELYAEISLPMIEAGNADRVAHMVGFIGLYFPEKATEIHNRLQTENN